MSKKSGVLRMSDATECRQLLPKFQRRAFPIGILEDKIDFQAVWPGNERYPPTFRSPVDDLRLCDDGPSYRHLSWLVDLNSAKFGRDFVSIWIVQRDEAAQAIKSISSNL